MYPFEIVIAVLAAFLWYMMNLTRFGMRLRAELKIRRRQAACRL